MKSGRPNNFGVEEEQQIRFPVTEEIAGPAPVNPATLVSSSSSMAEQTTDNR